MKQVEITAIFESTSDFVEVPAVVLPVCRIYLDPVYDRIEISDRSIVFFKAFRVEIDFRLPFRVTLAFNGIVTKASVSAARKCKPCKEHLSWIIDTMHQDRVPQTDLELVQGRIGDVDVERSDNSR